MIANCRLTNADWRFDGGTDLQLPIADLKSAITRSPSTVFDRPVTPYARSRDYADAFIERPRS